MIMQNKAKEFTRQRYDIDENQLSVENVILSGNQIIEALLEFATEQNIIRVDKNLDIVDEPDFLDGSYDDNGYGDIDKLQYKKDLEHYESSEEITIEKLIRRLHDKVRFNNDWAEKYQGLLEQQKSELKEVKKTMKVSEEDVLKAAREHYRLDERLKAIKLIKAFYGWHLKTCKEYCEENFETE